MATTHTLPRDVNSDKPSIHMSDSFKDVPPTDLAGDVDPEKAGLDGHAVAFDGKGHALVHLDKEAERKLTWKIDVRIVPIVTACYICCFIECVILPLRSPTSSTPCLLGFELTDGPQSVEHRQCSSRRPRTRLGDDRQHVQRCLGLFRAPHDLCCRLKLIVSSTLHVNSISVQGDPTHL